MDFFQSPLFKKTPYKARHTIFFIWLTCYFRCFVSPPLILRWQGVMQRSIICHATAWCNEVVLCNNTSTRSEFFRSGAFSLFTPHPPLRVDLSHKGERLGSFGELSFFLLQSNIGIKLSMVGVKVFCLINFNIHEF
jgi:hypothetical protein